MLLSFLKKKLKKIIKKEWNGIVAMALPKQEGKKIVLVCGNAIAEIGGKKFVAIVAMPLPKMGGKKKLVVAEIQGGIKKKKVLRSQYFYNKSHVISYCKD